MLTPTIENPSSPGMPAVEVESKKNLYTLFYIRGNAHHLYSKTFFHQGEFKSVIERGKRHCDAMSYRFIKVIPFISDLVADEKAQAERE